MIAATDSNSIIWKSEYNLGNLQIDKEHQHLFVLARKILSIGKINTDKRKEKELKPLIKDLFEYMKTHFSHEEAYMKKINYPELNSHTQIHLDIKQMMQEMMKQINYLHITEIQEKLTSLIQKYFIEHIINEDTKIRLWTSPLSNLSTTAIWKESYTLYDDRLDNEHKELFDIARIAFELTDNQHRTEKLKVILSDLYDYMQTHFLHEEEFMLKHNYPEIEQHKQLHDAIIKNINEFVKLIPSLEPELFEEELARLVDISLIQHIIQEDKKIADWINTKT